MYLTFDEYKTMGFSRVTDEATFKQHEVAAETQLDITTRFFYNDDLKLHSLSDDLGSTVSWHAFRAKQFKRAVALQCDYFDEVGADTPVGISQQSLSSVAIGRTHVQGSSIGGTNFGKTGLATGVVAILAQIGLISRAVSYR